MRAAAAIGLGVFAVGVILTWAADRVLLGATVMIVGAAGLFVLVLLSASRDASDLGDDLDRPAPVEEQNERLRAGWWRR
jgi:Flp pilus assembly protein TadB